METQFYISTEQYQQLKAAWKVLAANKDVHACDILIYNILRSKAPSRGFIAVTNALHIQGSNPWYAFNQAKTTADYKYSTTNRWSTPEQNAKKVNDFKSRFGIDLPVDLINKINGATHE
jgi:hypothetical protein